MPITIPPFVQYQEQMPPLRGLWNSAPLEGDRFVSASISWGVTTSPSMAVQFDLAGNSPVAMSQIVAMNVDNSRCGADLNFIFPDSGSVLVVPANSDLIAPVFTNALMFYVAAPTAAPGDVSIFQVLNSMPPPVAVQQPAEQQYAGPVVEPLQPGETVVVPQGVNGTIHSIQISTVNMTAGQFGQVSLVDGTGRTLWSGGIGGDQVISIADLRVRFFDGLRLLVAGTISAGTLTANVYYTVP